MSLTADMEARAVAALQALQGKRELAAAVWAEVNGFFARHPGIERTEFTAAFITSLYVDHFSTAAGSQSAQPKKAA